MKKVYAIERHVWDQWDNYGSGNTTVLKMFIKEGNAKRYLKTINVYKDKDLEYDIGIDYDYLEPFELVYDGLYSKEWIIPGPIGQDVDVTYYITEKELD